MKSHFLLSLFLSAVLSVPSVFALSLDEAKSKGLVGEQANGYLGTRDISAPVEALVADINAKRRTEYQKIAEKNGTTVGSVEVLAGKKALDATPKGQFVSTDGTWIKK